MQVTEENQKIHASPFWEKALSPKGLSKEDALALSEADSSFLKKGANLLRQLKNGDLFEFCSIISAKSGLCSEDCKFCAQSSWQKNRIPPAPLISKEKLLKHVEHFQEKKIQRFSLVTVGKKLQKQEVKKIAEYAEMIRKKYPIGICLSVGLLDSDDYKRLKDSGVGRIHNNLETSERFFPKICTTHTYADKLNAIEKAISHGMEICCGGLWGMGETIEDRIDLAFAIKELGVVSMPINILNPIQGTPLENQKPLEREEVEKSVALMKWINPAITLRMAGGRKQLQDGGSGCFLSGSHATITGNMLTVCGNEWEEDLHRVHSLGYKTLF